MQCSQREYVMSYSPVQITCAETLIKYKWKLIRNTGSWWEKWHHRSTDGQIEEKVLMILADFHKLLFHWCVVYSEIWCTCLGLTCCSYIQYVCISNNAMKWFLLTFTLPLYTYIFKKIPIFKKIYILKYFFGKCLTMHLTNGFTCRWKDQYFSETGFLWIPTVYLRKHVLQRLHYWL